MKLFSFIGSLCCAAALFTSCSGNMKTTDSASTCENAADAVMSNILTRTSIRQFTSQPIAADTLELLLRAGMAAPSAMNAQPWDFVVVTEREVLDSLMAVHPWANLQTATAAIIVCGNMEKAIEGPAREYWVQDCSAVTENILLAAHAYGLGAVWCGVYPDATRVDDVKRVLNLPENIIPLDITTLGYPAENPEPKDKWNPENVHYQKW